MATVTNPIILDSTGQDIKNSIDLLTANINRTASNIPYDSNLTIKAAIDGKVSKTGDTMTGNLNIKPANTLGAISLGKGSNSSEYGVVQMYDDASHWLNIMPSSQTDNRMIFFPDKAGTVALTSDLLYPANTTIRAFGSFTVITGSFCLPHFYVPLENALMYDIEFVQMEQVATQRIATLQKSQWYLSVSNNGFYFFSDNADVRYWLTDGGQNDMNTSIFGFTFTVSPRS